MAQKKLKTLHCEKTPIDMDIMIQLERVIPTADLRKLIAGETINITFDQQFRIMELITDLDSTDIAAMTPQEVALELGFFTRKLAMSMGKGHVLSLVLPFLLMSPDEVNHLLQMCSQLLPDLPMNRSNIFAAQLLDLKPNTSSSENSASKTSPGE